MQSRVPWKDYVDGKSGSAMKTNFGSTARMLVMVALACAVHAETPPSAISDGYVPCKIHQRVRIEFPSRLLGEGLLHGEAVLMLDVDRAGQLADVLVVGYTRREFADSAREAVQRWRFTPGSIAGEPVRSTITLAVEFQVTGVLAYVKPVGLVREEEVWGERFVYRPLGVAELDRVPVAISRTGPMYLKEWIAQGRTGTVTTEFFIDEKGQVRFPRVAGPADEYLGAAAVAAVKEWRFEAPLHRGRPVLVRARQVFNFQPEVQASKQ
jgi:TonB family protein